MESLLGPNDPAPAVVLNPEGRSPFLLIGDHAGFAIPTALGTLGLRSIDRERHIAIDIGVHGLGERLAADLDACFIHQRYSRLVVDCNRDPAAPEAIPTTSDGTVIVANQDLSRESWQQRIAAIHRPYQDCISAQIAARAGRSQPSVLISLHSFTPSLGGIRRPWDIGVLHSGGRTRFARCLIRALERLPDICVGDNEPYKMDETDYTVPHHAFASGLCYAELEIRQDQIAEIQGQEQWSDRLATMMVATFKTMSRP